MLSDLDLVICDTHLLLSNLTFNYVSTSLGIGNEMSRNGSVTSVLYVVTMVYTIYACAYMDTQCMCSACTTHIALVLTSCTATCY